MAMFGTLRMRQLHVSRKYTCNVSEVREGREEVEVFVFLHKLDMVLGRRF